MKKIIIFISVIATALMFGLSTANAWSISIEPRTTDDLFAGDTFYADIYFNADADGNMLESFSFALRYDTEELLWNSATASSQWATISGLYHMFGYATEEESGFIEDWLTSGMMGSDGVSMTGSTLMASVEFTVLDGATLDGEQDVWFETDSCVFLIDETLYYPSMTEFTQAAIDVGAGAVPIPGTLMLLGLGLVGIVGFKRRNV